MKTITYLQITVLVAITILNGCSDDDFTEVEEPNNITQEIETITLLGDATFPEGILTTPNGELLVGGFGDGSIQLINSENQASYFNLPGANGLFSTVGMAIDIETGHLWVANLNFDIGTGNPGSNLKVFDLNSGALIKTIPEDFVEGAFFNEIAIDDNGRVYVSDTFAPVIWTAVFDDETPERFVENELLSNPARDQPFDLNGLAISEDGTTLIASVMDRLDAGDGRLVKIDIESRNVSAIELNGAAVSTFAGSDGMFFDGNLLFMVNVFSASDAIITAEFNTDFTQATLRIRDAFQEEYNRPTASDILNGRLFTVNSQLNHIIDDADGELDTPPELPFTIVGVPLDALLE